MGDRRDKCKGKKGKKKREVKSQWGRGAESRLKTALDPPCKLYWAPFECEPSFALEKLALSAGLPARQLWPSHPPAGG